MNYLLVHALSIPCLLWVLNIPYIVWGSLPLCHFWPFLTLSCEVWGEKEAGLFLAGSWQEPHSHLFPFAAVILSQAELGSCSVPASEVRRECWNPVGMEVENCWNQSVLLLLCFIDLCGAWSSGKNFSSLFKKWTQNSRNLEFKSDPDFSGEFLKFSWNRRKLFLGTWAVFLRS